MAMNFINVLMLTGALAVLTACASGTPRGNAAADVGASMPASAAATDGAWADDGHWADDGSMAADADTMCISHGLAPGDRRCKRGLGAQSGAMESAILGLGAVRR